MNDNNVLFLVGNGFNYFLNQYINEENEKKLLEKLHYEDTTIDECEMRLEKLKQGLKEYCNLLNFLKLDNYVEQGETLLSRLDKFFYQINEDEKRQLQSINQNLTDLIISRIDNIFKNTAIVKNGDKSDSYINATGRRLMFDSTKDTGKTFAKNIESIVNKVSNNPYYIYTTNYDYIVGSVFTEYNKHQNKPKNFLEGENRFVQLHGKYDSNGKSNIICCSPDKKIGKVRELGIFDDFKEKLMKSNIIVIFGLGLTSDPHILNLLNEKENNNIIIIDSDKDKYYRNHYPKSENRSESKFQFLKNNNIYFIDTGKYFYDNNFMVNKINTPEKLLAILSKIFESIY